MNKKTHIMVKMNNIEHKFSQALLGEIFQVEVNLSNDFYKLYLNNNHIKKLILHGVNPADVGVKTADPDKKYCIFIPKVWFKIVSHTITLSIE